MRIDTALHLIGLLEPPSNQVNHWLTKFIDDAVCILEPEAWRFDAIAFTGVSGALIAPSVAMALGKALTVVRKEKSSHSSRIVEGALDCRFLILDDIVDSGHTVRRIQKQIWEVSSASNFVGFYLFKGRDLILKGLNHRDQGTFLQQHFLTNPNEKSHTQKS